MGLKIDHVIIRLPYDELVNLPDWLTSNFTTTPGGRHADGRTENKLICFRDGSYIELIAFVNDDFSLRKGHWWGDHTPGFIDWALTTDKPSDIFDIAGRIANADTGLSVSYARPMEGGRTRPDGKEVKWRVTFPENARRGEVPFWCHDLTDRELRVPQTVAATTHPCGALGIAQITVCAPEERLPQFRRFYDALVGVKDKQPAIEGEECGWATWDIEAPIHLGTSQKPQIGLEAGCQYDEEDAIERSLFAVISDVVLHTDSIGIGQSRDALFEKIGDEDVCFQFIHGRHY